MVKSLSAQTRSLRHTKDEDAFAILSVQGTIISERAAKMDETFDHIFEPRCQAWHTDLQELVYK